MAETPIQLIVRAQDRQGAAKNPTAAELAAALTFAHRVLNRLAVDEDDSVPSRLRSSATLREEPGVVNFEITSANNGSVVLAGIVAIASDPFVQGIAGGVVANVLTPRLLKVAEKTKRLFRRPAKASAGRVLQVELDVESSNVKVEAQYLDNEKTKIRVQVRQRQAPSARNSDG
jgi:hypothetical protein